MIGFGPQDTLGNLFAGLAIQIEKPFRSASGCISRARPRARSRGARPRFDEGRNFVIVPNSALSRDTITNYWSRRRTRASSSVGASYDTPPNEVKAVILAAIKDDPLISPEQAPEALLVDFAASAVTYRIRVGPLTSAPTRKSATISVRRSTTRSGAAIRHPVSDPGADEAWSRMPTRGGARMFAGRSGAVPCSIRRSSPS